MQAIQRVHKLPVLVVSIALLGIGALAIGMCVQPGAITPPNVNLRLGVLQIVAYTTHYPECPPHTICPLEAVRP
jgi:hypothetical protein